VIVLRLGIEPTDMELDERPQMRLTVSATNAGVEMVDPELYRTELLVDGKPSMVFAETIANGRRAEKWVALPAGDTVSMTWSGLGAFVLPGPGEHTLVLALNQQESEPVTVTVR
jgi:hypothetical protein